jgi:UTP--glucose-1-phosphate uridylyltransferase
VVVTAAGLGTRLLPATKEQPKEMLSIFVRGANGQCCLKPLLQCIFEQLHNVGFREFCFVTGRRERIMKNHFTQDHAYVELLKSKGSLSQASELESFYTKLHDSTVVWANQSEARGFGDAVLKSQSIVGNERFLVSAGDVYVKSPEDSHIRRLIECSDGTDAEAVFLAQEVEDPLRHGVVELEHIHGGIHEVKRAVEKPKSSPSKVAIIPIYLFKPIVFKALGQIKPGIQGSKSRYRLR